MGYTTEFNGNFELSRELEPDEALAIRAFSEARHGGDLDPFPGYPGFWCNWTVSEDNRHIEWNGSEKFYHYVEWLDIVINRFLVPFGVVATGKVEWRGENWDDTGTIVLERSTMTIERRKRG